MAIITSKWFLTTGLLLVLPVVLYFLGHKTVHTELIIAAEPDEIWAVLMDSNSYQEWNPVLIPIEGELREGEKLTYKMIAPGNKESLVNTKVVKLVERQILNQYGGIFGILTFDHKWLLEKAREGTKVIQHEEYRGIGVLFWDSSWVEPAYRRALEGLKDRVGKLHD